MAGMGATATGLLYIDSDIPKSVWLLHHLTYEWHMLVWTFREQQKEVLKEAQDAFKESCILHLRNFLNFFGSPETADKTIEFTIISDAYNDFLQRSFCPVQYRKTADIALKQFKRPPFEALKVRTEDDVLHPKLANRRITKEDWPDLSTMLVRIETRIKSLITSLPEDCQKYCRKQPRDFIYPCPGLHADYVYNTFHDIQGHLSSE